MEDERVVILLGDIGVFSFREAFAHDPSRIYNLGILEQSMIGVAAGLAEKGFIPFVHSIAPFITERCLEQIKIDLAYESHNVFVVSVGNSYDYSRLGVTHQCPNDLALLNTIPNLGVYCPGNSMDAQKIVNKTIETKRPKYIRLSEFENSLGGQQGILQHGDKGMIIVVGNAIKNIDELLKANIPSTIYYTYDISEIDIDFIRLSQKKDITIVEPCSDSGIVSKISLNICGLKKIRSIAVPKMFIDKYGSKDELDKYLGLDDKTIINKLKRIYTS